MKRATIDKYAKIKKESISIHALVKRATQDIHDHLSEQDISIHALVKRATPQRLFQNHKYPNFNPRPREEGDGNLELRRYGRCYFNPRPREEGDSVLKVSDVDSVISIHALVKRATFADMSKKRYKRYFNPRPREEGDKYRKPFDKRVTISIHALVKRATGRWR